MTRPALIAAAAASLAGAFLAGRYSRKPQQVDHERIVYRDRVVQAEAQQHTEARVVTVAGPERIRVVRYACPDGRVSEVTETTRGEARTEATTQQQETARVQEHATESVRERLVVRPADEPRWRLGPAVGLRLDGTREWGVAGGVRLGPLEAGAMVATDRRLWLSAMWRW